MFGRNKLSTSNLQQQLKEALCEYTIEKRKLDAFIRNYEDIYTTYLKTKNAYETALDVYVRNGGDEAEKNENEARRRFLITRLNKIDASNAIKIQNQIVEKALKRYEKLKKLLNKKQETPTSSEATSDTPQMGE